MERENQASEQEQIDFQKHLSPPTIMAIPFLALNRYDRLFLLLYLAIAIALLAYKNSVYPLPSYALACEGTILAMLSLTQALRYRLAQRAVAEKELRMIVLYLFATLFVLMSLIFGLRLQTYIALAEVITGWVGIGFIIAEVICALWILKVLQRKKRGR